MKFNAILKKSILVLILLVTYCALSILIWYIFDRNTISLLQFINSPNFNFYIGLILFFIIGILWVISHDETGWLRNMLFLISFVFIILGLAYIVLSFNKSLWENEPYIPNSYDPTVFGVGISIGALGFAFLLAAKSIRNKQIQSTDLDQTLKNLSDIDGKLKGLATKIEKLNSTINDLNNNLGKSQLNDEVIKATNEIKQIDVITKEFTQESKKFTNKISQINNILK